MIPVVDILFSNPHFFSMDMYFANQSMQPFGRLIYCRQFFIPDDSFSRVGNYNLKEVQ